MAQDEPYLRCIACGYDLRALSPEGVCPECGLAIARSFDGDKLARADPDWLSTMARGATLMLWGMSLVVGLIPLVLLFMLIVVLASGRRPPSAFVDTTGIVLAASCAILGALMTGIGAFLLGTPDPGRDQSVESPKICLMLRCGWLPVLMTTVAAFSVVLLPLTPAVQYAFMTKSMIASMWLASLVFAAALFRMRTLFRRVPHPRWADRARKHSISILWTVPLFLVLHTVDRMIGPAGTVTPASGLLYSAISCSTVVVGLGVLVNCGAAIELAFCCRRAVRSSLDVARQLHVNLSNKDREEGVASCR